MIPLSLKTTIQNFQLEKLTVKSSSLLGFCEICPNILEAKLNKMYNMLKNIVSWIKCKFVFDWHSFITKNAIIYFFYNRVIKFMVAFTFALLFWGKKP
jgi:hypothetical protein